MAESKFGGESVDAEPKSQFGGELISRPSKSIAKRPGESTAAEKIAGFGYGLGTSLVGAPGEIEEFLTTPAKGPKLLGEGQMLPTTKQVQKGLKEVGVEPPEGTRGSQTAGEITGALIPAGPAAFRGLGKAVGETTKEGSRVAQFAEKLGFKLSPSQVRADAPISEKGAIGFAKHNQTLANRLASEGTGKQVDEISESFISKQFNDLGKEFNEVYKGKDFAIDPSAKGTLASILQKETDLGFAGSTTVRQATEDISKNIDQGFIRGDDLQRLRNALTERARSTNNKGNAHEIYNLVDQLDAAVEKLNPQMAKKLEVLRPQYRNNIILEDVNKAGGLRQGNISLEILGNVLRSDATRVKNPKDIDNLGLIGREIGLKARWQSEGQDVPGIVEKGTRTHGLLPTIIRGATFPLRTKQARAAQRYAERGSAPQKTLEALGATLPPYEFGKAVSNKNE